MDYLSGACVVLPALCDTHTKIFGIYYFMFHDRQRVIEVLWRHKDDDHFYV